MQEFWKKHHFEVVLTEDQSPTLRWLASDNQETMHHRGGAFSETQHIYGDPLRAVLAQGGRSAVSVGLGLGYNEILVAVEAFKAGILPGDFRLLSFESEAVLRDQFLAWVLGEAETPIYDQVWEFYAQVSGTPSLREVRNWLLEARRRNAWKLEGALEPDFQVSQKYECIFYDAFSSKTSPHLWQQDFLQKFWTQISAEKCLVTTYACTGALKRSLKESGFELILPPGFQSKRNRTMGCREFKSSWSFSDP